MKLITMSLLALYLGACSNKQAEFAGGSTATPAGNRSMEADAVATHTSPDAAGAYEGTTSALPSTDTSYEQAATPESSAQGQDSAADAGAASSAPAETTTPPADTTTTTTTTPPADTTTTTTTTPPADTTTTTTTTPPADTTTTTTTTPPPADFKVEIQNDATAVTEGSSSNISESELKGCRDYFGGQGRVVVYTNTGSVALGPNDILALKVTGNNQMVSVALAPVTTQSTMLNVKGLCFFLAGNDARASVSLKGTALERIWNRALGNGAQTTVNIGANASVGQFEIATNGNGSKLIIQGEGAYTCPVGHPYIECTR